MSKRSLEVYNGMEQQGTSRIRVSNHPSRLVVDYKNVRQPQKLPEPPSTSQENLNYERIQKLYAEVYTLKDESDNMKQVITHLLENSRKQDEKINALIKLNSEMWRNFGLNVKQSGVQCGMQTIVYN